MSDDEEHAADHAARMERLSHLKPGLRRYMMRHPAGSRPASHRDAIQAARAGVPIGKPTKEAKKKCHDGRKAYFKAKWKREAEEAVIRQEARDARLAAKHEAVCAFIEEHGMRAYAELVRPMMVEADEQRRIRASRRLCD